MTLEETIDRMKSGKLYNSGAEELLKVQSACLEKMYDYNATRPSEGEKRSALIKEMFAEAGENCYIEPPLHANWGGHHVHFGKGVQNHHAHVVLALCDVLERVGQVGDLPVKVQRVSSRNRVDLVFVVPRSYLLVGCFCHAGSLFESVH